MGNKASDSKHLPNKINHFFPKVSNLPPIVPLPKDVQVVGWKKHKKSKSKTKNTLPPPEIPIKPPPKSQSKSENKKNYLSTSTSDTSLQSSTIIPIPDKEIKQELILSSQEATAPVINVIQIEPSQKQTFSTPALKSKIKNKKVDL